MLNSKRKIGDLGEELACRFLVNKGYLILETNYCKKIGEIDIVAEFDSVLHFVEVKTRTKRSIDKFGLPQEAVGFCKQKRLLKTALSYLGENNYSGDTNWQIDVIAIKLDTLRKSAEIKHIKNAVDYNGLG